MDLGDTMELEFQSFHSNISLIMPSSFGWIFVSARNSRKGFEDGFPSVMKLYLPSFESLSEMAISRKEIETDFADKSLNLLSVSVGLVSFLVLRSSILMSESVEATIQPIGLQIA